ncbi:MAG: hypothetical protein ABI459_02955 [Deltaproteobacteria bacterium]
MKLILSLVFVVMAALNGCQSKTDVVDDVGSPENSVLAAEKCTRTGGIWSTLSETQVNLCVQPTGQGAQSCQTRSDCKGECFAKSKTCAPYKPLIGCNEVIGANGATQTLCFN